jgi:diaminohydroxyphosphoribosylaminopyrimidine deaminase/5-amino-6-(5-phosphoribosylamino)uracil reductase
MLRCRGRAGRVDLAALLGRLARRGVTSLLVEGGAEVAGSFLAAGLVDRLLLFLSPRVAGADGLSWAGGAGPRRMADALRLGEVEVSRVGEDLLVSARPVERDRKPRVD